MKNRTRYFTLILIMVFMGAFMNFLGGVLTKIKFYKVLVTLNFFFHAGPLLNTFIACSNIRHFGH